MSLQLQTRTVCSVSLCSGNHVVISAEGGYVFGSVCLSVYPSDNWKSCERILTEFLGGIGHGPGTNEFNFGNDPDHRPDPGVRSPKSGFSRLSNYQRILMKFYGELGCGLETNWLHFGDDPHYYPHPGVRSGSRSGSGKNCHNSIMLAFGGGMCSLSTSTCSFHLQSIEGDYLRSEHTVLTSMEEQYLAVNLIHWAAEFVAYPSLDE